MLSSIRFSSLVLLLLALLIPQTTLAEVANKIIAVDEKNKQVTVEINGVQYKLDLDQAVETNTSSISQNESPSSVALSASITDTSNGSTTNNNDAELERQFIALQSKENKYTGLPTVLSTRLYTTPTDRLMKQGHWGLDFTHRFASSFRQDNDLFGFDSFAYSSFGVQYGLTDWAEIHAMRANIGDSYEVGLKTKLLRETKDFSLLHPVNITLNTGFQNDNMQNSLDPYIQLIVSRSIVPKRVQAYASPIYAWRTNSINSGGSSSAIYSSFVDNQGRSAGNQGTFAIPLGLAVELIKNRMTLVGEMIPVLSGFQENKMGWATGLQFLSRKETHIWSIGLSNMPYVTTGQAIVGGPDNTLHLGFNVNVFL